jgi:hypothetical protein
MHARHSHSRIIIKVPRQGVAPTRLHDQLTMVRAGVAGQTVSVGETGVAVVGAGLAHLREVVHEEPSSAARGAFSLVQNQCPHASSAHLGRLTSSALRGTEHAHCGLVVVVAWHRQAAGSLSVEGSEVSSGVAGEAGAPGSTGIAIIGAVHTNADTGAEKAEGARGRAETVAFEEVASRTEHTP